MVVDAEEVVVSGADVDASGVPGCDVGLSSSS
jgi:hypothetical protein